MKRVLSSICLVVACVAISAAQGKPNFAGTWKPTSDQSAAGGFAVSELSATQDDKSLVVTATGQMGAIKTNYNLDGTEAKSPLDFGGNSIDRVTKASWDGSKLVLSAVSNFNGQAFEIKEVWSLDAAGMLVIESTRPDFQGGGAPVTSKATYKKG